MKQWENLNKDLIFSLDIGTRTIIGIVGSYSADEKLNILAYSIKEHRKGICMMDRFMILTE